MATVTALHPERRDRVRVELDGEPWRTVARRSRRRRPGLRVGLVLDRRAGARAAPSAPPARRPSRRPRRALARATARVADSPPQLERRGVRRRREPGRSRRCRASATSTTTVSPLAARASLAARGYGDEAIRFELEQQGVGAEQIAVAIDGLTSELERARTIVAASGATGKTARRLAAKGFAAEAIESAVGELE